MSWNAIKGWKWKELDDGIIQFTFANRNDAMNVLNRRPLFVCGALLVIMPWPSWLSPAEVRFDKTPIWVQVDSIPPFYWNLSNLKEIASKASPVYELPHGIEDAVGMSSLRFRATIDLNKPIFSGFFLRRQKLKDLWLQYKYERLPQTCFKCGIINHDQSTCFKSPTVVKDAKGNFYPMFGTWLKKEVPEKLTFSTPLAKWFQDWVLQKQLGNDPILRNQFKVHRAIQNGESDEIRECRRQYPTKKRIVSDEEEATETDEPNMVITQIPLVYLPGIGEFAPYGNNSKMVSVLDLQQAATKDSMVTANGASSSNTVEDNDTENNADKSLRMKGTGKTKISISGATNKDNSRAHLNQSRISNNQPEDLAETGESPTNKQISDFDMGPSKLAYNPLLGTQAQLIDWPSNECWADPKARELIFGSLTVDKYYREPTLINPILDIEDFRVQEHSQGPRKRKASDGLLINPSPVKSFNSYTNNTPASQSKESYSEPETQDNTTGKNAPTVQQQLGLDTEMVSPPSSFSPGTCMEQGSSSKRRSRGGRSGKAPIVHDEPVEKKRRGQPPKNHPTLSATPKSFKGRKQTKINMGGKSGKYNHIGGSDFDLKVDLNNHFIVIEKTTKPRTMKNTLSGVTADGAGGPDALMVVGDRGEE
ncbi:hypothetical protein G4B88_000697 [Cannabis sativa]|uniref:DUF4283 domain-containing protein n=1 Tax=Cannabis sativa TaxID=3483 RepID=A0A7J6ENU5_CANSA|nr:hypothetical protein G4B88_000697 [Cannabis sativa]